MMSSKAGRIVVLILAPLVILMLPVAVYLVDRSIHDGKLPRNVSIAGVDVAGLPPEEALTVVRTSEAERYAQPAVFVVNGIEFELDPSDVGLDADVDSALSVAVAEADHNVVSGLIPWMRSFSTTLDIPVAVTLNGEAIDAYLDEWERAAIAEPAFDGDLAVVDGGVRVDYPKPGLRIDRDAARKIVQATLVSDRRDQVDLPLTDRPPAFSEADLDAAAATIETLINKPVILTNPDYDYTLVVPRNELASAVTIDFVTDGTSRIDVGLNTDALTASLEPQLADFERPPVEVELEASVATNRVTITPPRNGTRVDIDALAAAIQAAAADGGRGELPIVDDIEPRITAEDVEAWGPLTLVSQFTTGYKSGQARVTNIQLMARTVDGSIVWPGETFSVNETVGKRTEAKGYVRAPAIINGGLYCCDSPVNVGGGVSQFGTTIFNAVFYGGYEDVEHKPHSIYFSHYPEGREATLGYPHPDVKFRNNTDAPVIIKTSYNSSSLTVKFFGNNGGLKVTSERSDRFGYTAPITIYEENPRLSPGTERVTKRGSQGWSVTVTRIITYPDGRVVREPFTWRYRGNPKTIEVASCETGTVSNRCTSTPTSTVPTTTTSVPEETTSTTTSVPEETTTTTEPPDTSSSTTTTTQAPDTSSSTTTTTQAGSDG